MIPVEHSLAFTMAQASAYLTKLGGDATPTYAMSGRLVLSNSGWILLEVPNNVVRGVFSSIDEPGIELPLSSAGSLNAHISVIRPEELEKIGGADKVTETGKRFRYQLGPVKSVKPDGWGEMSKVWFVAIRSPELEALRKSYGLSALPNNNQYEFHITVAVRRKRVLQANGISKAASELLSAITKEAKSFNPATSFSHALTYSAADAGRTIMDQLEEAKAESQRRNYRAKQVIMRKLLSQYPDQFAVRPHGSMLSIRHKPSRFALHMAPSALPSLFHRRKRTMEDVVNDAYTRLSASVAESAGLGLSPEMQDLRKNESP